jgi:hypothetical protein|tara:strand:- start:1052 stop:1285 length:234 start_codon:yes stop_codon:yes gene_type:complete
MAINKEKLGVARPAKDMVIGASILGIGATVVTRTGGPVGGISAAASFLPILGAQVGGSVALRELRKLQNQDMRKRRR